MMKTDERHTGNSNEVEEKKKIGEPKAVSIVINNYSVANISIRSDDDNVAKFEVSTRDTKDSKNIRTDVAFTRNGKDATIWDSDVSDDDTSSSKSENGAENSVVTWFHDRLCLTKYDSKIKKSQKSQKSPKSTKSKISEKSKTSIQNNEENMNSMIIAENETGRNNENNENMNLRTMKVEAPPGVGSTRDESHIDSEKRNVKMRGKVQFAALIRKHFILKCRTPALTFFEIFCPFAMIWILTAVFDANGITEVSARDYSKFMTEVPGILMAYLYQMSYISFPPEFENDTIDLESDPNLLRKLQSTQQQDLEFSNNFQNLDTIFASPLPVPSLNHYIRLHQIFKQAFENTAPSNLQELQNTQDFVQRWGNLLVLGNIHVVGDQIAQDFIDHVHREHSDLPDNLSFLKWSNHEDALEYINSVSAYEATWALLDFTNGNQQNSFNEEYNQIQYTIRMNNTLIPFTRFQISMNAVGYDTYYQQYYSSGYLTLQKTVNDFFLSRNDACEVPGEFDIWTVPMPTAAFSQNEFFLFIGYLLAMAIGMAYLFPVSRLIKSIVEEKESRMKQTLFILGVKPWAHWLSWIVFNILFFMVISAFVTSLLAYKIAQHSDKVILYCFIFSFAISVMSFSFFVSAFFSRAKLASILGPLLFFGTLLPRYIFLGTRQEEGKYEKMWASIAPCTAFAFGAELLAELEYAEQGFQWWNITNGGFDVAMSISVMVFDSVFYLALAWYIEQVFPSQYGVRKKWYFFIQPMYWRSIFGCTVDVSEKEIVEENNPNRESSNNYQITDDSLIPQVEIKNLVKIYKKGLEPAVNELNLTLYEDQITCLLGHNGAGKSTTMSVLTGLFSPTKGDCFIYKKSIRKELSKLRESMGICPQHNVIFDDLTVYEHIRLFETIKGIKPTQQSIVERAKEVDLDEKLFSYAKTLSGGQKRKLCVAMALCGEPKFVLLDEPTSGMDVFSRRSTWELLRKKKKGRVILLTTHFMDEAELLADRIAVLSSGKLQCYGTNLFLKERFGLGYNLTLVIDHAATTVSEDNIESNSNGINSDLDIEERVTRITTFLQSHVSNVELLRVSGRELIFRFPPGSETQFQTLFSALEDTKHNLRKDLGIGGYGVTNTTLEEIFLRLANEQEHEENIDVPSTQQQPVSFLRGEGEEKVFEQVSKWAHIKILLEKRWKIQKRDIKGFIFQIVLPLLAVALALAFLILNFIADQPPMEVSTDLYHLARRVYNTNILVGGSLDNMEATAVEMKNMFESQYPDVAVDFIPEIKNSSEMSTYMLDTYHDFDHAWRYQSYVFNDTIELNLIQNWEDIRFILENGHPNSVGNDGVVTIDLDDPVYDNQFDLIEISNFVYSSTSLEPETKVNIPTITRLLHATLGFVGNDELHEIVDQVATIFQDVTNVEEFFSTFSVQTGGTAQDLNATYSLSFDSVSFDAVKETIQFNNVVITLEDIDSILNAEQVFFEYKEGFRVSLHFIKWEEKVIVDKLTIPIPVTDEIEKMLESIFLVDLTVDDPADYDSAFKYISTLLPENTTTSTSLIYPDVTILFNTSSYHAISASYQGYVEFLYKKCTSNPQARIVSINHPFPLTEQASIELKTRLSVFASLFTLIPFCYVPAAFIIFIVRERSCKSKHLQLVSGVDMAAYWLATYLWDIGLWAIFTVLSMGLFSMYGANSAEVFVGDISSFLCTLTVIFGYGLSALPFAYLLSRNFKNHATAQISVLGLFFVTGFIAVLTYVILRSFAEFRPLAKNLRYLFRLWPAYNMGDALIRLSRNYLVREVYGVDRSPFDLKVCGKHIIYLYGLSVPYFLMVLFMEYSGDGGSGGLIGRLLRNLRVMIDQAKLWLYKEGPRYDSQDEELDFDVAKEKEYVFTNKRALVKKASVLLVNVWKIFPPSTTIVRTILLFPYRCWNFCRQRKEELDPSRKPKKAVSGMTTAIMPGETFGLLGVNGAGKTTTMAVLTGDIAPTSGEAYVAGYDVTGKTSGGLIKARKQIGFCPQIDPLLDLMTARETLTMFGKLRGIPKANLNLSVNNLIDALGLTLYADKTAGKYSGGNRRKLSLGIAIIGDPKVLFIDEASSGMDVVARRKMWQLISEIGKKRSVILTTHSMEEAEALCSRIGIMIAGQMRCIGSVQHLKSRYLNGYTVDIQCKPDASSFIVDSVFNVLTNIFPESILKERHGRFLRLDIKSDNCGLRHVFEKLQEMKENPNFMIENYSISQCTLEQVFIKLVKEEHGESYLLDNS